MSEHAPLGLFEGFGIELEYMIVDVESLDVKPIADVLLEEMGGPGASDVELGPIAWSNELARHVIELKTNGPVASLSTVAEDFAPAVRALEQIAARHGARLMPTGMHPWMVPEREFKLWPNDPEEIYGTFDRIFDCRGHGWSNLQSMHINLPFANDAEFQRLHSAVRFILPLLPALGASSPFVEGKPAAHLDQRLAVYRTNARKVPTVSGDVIPESAGSRAEYQARILDPIYAQLAPHDPEGALRYEWVNARGAIARFDRMAVEIRVLDAQECPLADLATAYLVTETLRPLVMSGHFVAVDADFSAGRLARIYDGAVCDAEASVVSDSEYLSLWGFAGATRLSLREIWQDLLRRVPEQRRDATLHAAAALTVESSLATRLRLAVGGVSDRRHLREVYGRVCDSLRTGSRLT